MNKETSSKIAFLLIVATSILLISCRRTDVSYYDSGIKKHEINYKGDLKDGICKWWYANGTLSTVAEYDEGKLNGKYQKFSGEAVIISSQEYINDMKNGISMTYNKNGDLIELTNYINDTLDGQFSSFHDNGVERISGFYKKGLFDSIWTYRNEENLVIGRGNFKDGTGVLKYWLITGVLMRETNYVYNEKDGLEIMYNPDGTIEQKRLYKNGKLQSVE